MTAPTIGNAGKLTLDQRASPDMAALARVPVPPEAHTVLAFSARLRRSLFPRRLVPSTLTRAKAAGATMLGEPYKADGRKSAMVQFPGGYIAEASCAT
jgi:hypothetical protein